MFFFKKKKGDAARGDEAAKSKTPQKRSSFRMPVEFDVMYALRGRQGRRHGRANDLSAGGLRLSTDEDFLKNSVLDLDFQLPDEFVSELTIEKEVFKQTPFGLRPETVKTAPAPFAPMRMSAIVLSTFYVPATKSLAHGTKFIELPEEVQEELQRFIHLWQLHQIRLRAEAMK
ncbi:MAG TPA: PilZ domain-containing protein [Candidatus Acidoferrum sp.]|nr:PilZ domain-containing protein [Candidatus Acidoferrum sp.]